MSRVCTICARSGSKGLPGKNTRLLLGKPLIAHTVEQARESGLFDVIAVSSDSPEIRKLGIDGGATMGVERPIELANDVAGKLPAIVHCTLAAEADFGSAFDTVVDLDVTSPLRSIQDIADAVRTLEESGAPNLITVAPARRSPYFNLVERTSSGRVYLCKPSTIKRRQDSPECFDMNASIYVWRRSSLFENPTVFNTGTIAHVMAEERSFDIDSELDFELVEFLMRRRETKK